MLSNKEFLKRMLPLSIPIALQNLLSSCGYLVDTAMVVSLGNVATSAIGVASRWSFLTNIVAFGICSGCATLIAQYWGAGDRERIHKSAGLALTGVTICSVLYICIAVAFPEFMMAMFTDEAEVISAGKGYIQISSFNMLFNGLMVVAGSAMRSTEDVRSPFIASTVGVGVNIVFNYILIYGKLGFPCLGLEGAALATVISGIVQLACIMFMAVRKKSVILGPAHEMFSWSGEFFRKYIKVAAPILCNEFIWVVGTSMYSMILARQGSENYSAYTIFTSINEVFFVFYIGVCAACAIMVGKTVGEGDREGAYNTAKKFLITVPLMSLFIGAAIILLRYPILSTMNIETEGARRTAAQLLVVSGLMMPLSNLPYVAVVGVFRAGGDGKYGFFIDTFSIYAMGIPALAFLAFRTEATFVEMVAGMYLAEYIFKNFLCIRRFRSGKWIRRLV